MQRIIKLLFIILILNQGCSSVETKKEEETHSVVNYSKSKLLLPKVILDSLKPGDIVLRRGDGPLSYHLSNTTKEPFTHCGIIVKEQNIWKVIHTIGGQVSKQEIDGIQKTTLKHFIDFASDSLLYICRPIFMDSANFKIVKRANYYLDLKVPFDHRFSIIDDKKFYCSELLYHIFKDINNNKNVFVIKKKHKAYLLMFSTFFNPTNFKRIYSVKPTH